MRSDYLGKVFWGLVVIAAGVLLLFNQTGLIHFDIGYLLSTYWPVLLILLGLRGFVFGGWFGRGGFLWNVMIILIGFYFLMNNLNVNGFSLQNLSRFILPIILILFGLNMLFKNPMRERKVHSDSWTNDTNPVSDKIEKKRLKMERRAAKRAERKDWQHWKHESYPGPGAQQRHNFIGDIHLGEDYWELTPLNISHFIGDTVVDLTKATIPLGETKISVSAFIGDFKLFVPRDMEVEFRVSATAFISDMNVLDRYESGLGKHMQTETADYHDAERKILISVSMFIGDITVMRVG